MTTPSAREQDWLLDSGSLTARLKHHCNQLTVQVLRQYSRRLSAQEYRRLGFLSCRYALIREVILWTDQEPAIIASTVIPFSTLTRKELRLRYLKENPLGEFLKKYSSWSRTLLGLKHMPLQQLIAPEDLPIPLLHQAISSRYWTRESIFLSSNKPLLLTELFLPKVFAIA